MVRWLSLGLVGALAWGALACDVGPRSGRGFRLPDGDVDRGAVAFQELGCTRCHDVIGDPPPTRTDRPDVIVTLGGEVTRVETYGELVTSIIHPSYELSGRYPKEQVAEGEVSRMERENLNERMSVAQLIDLTAFLGQEVKLRIYQHTREEDQGFFTLMDDLCHGEPIDEAQTVALGDPLDHGV